MATYTRETRVRAPLEEVWSFHSSVDGLEALTPPYLHLRVHDVVGTDGRTVDGDLQPGTRVHLSIRPFGVGPRREWVSVITERYRDDDAAHFRDVMESGPFREWEHLHEFVAAGDETVLVDRVDYQLPGGRLGRAVSPLGVLGFEPMFRARHRRTRELLEDG